MRSFFYVVVLPLVNWKAEAFRSQEPFLIRRRRQQHRPRTTAVSFSTCRPTTRKTALFVKKQQSFTDEQKTAAAEVRNETAAILREQAVNNSNSTTTTTTATAAAEKEAAKLRRRAKEILAEARAMEAALEESRSMQRKKKHSEAQSMFDRLFFQKRQRPITPEAVARVLREERWSVDQAVAVLKLMYRRLQQASPPSSAKTGAGTTGKEKEFQIAATSNADLTNETEAALLNSYVQCLMDAAAILDEETGSPTTDEKTNKRWTARAASTLKSRWNEMRLAEEKEIQRRLEVGMLNDNNVGGAVADRSSSSNVSVTDYMRQTLGLPTKTTKTDGDDVRQFNISKVLERVAMVPMWVPSSLLSYMVASRAQVLKEDIRVIKERVLPGSGFFCTSSDSIPTAAIFRGNVRVTTQQAPWEVRNQTAKVFEEIQRRVDEKGISERLQLFFMPDPEWRPSREEPEPKPVLLVLSKEVEPDDSKMKEKLSKTIFKRASVVLSFLTTFAYSVKCYALNPSLFDAIVNQSNIMAAAVCIPVCIGIWAIQGIHEVAHILVARLREIKIGFPVPLPSPQLGTFGCITPLRSFPANRAALLDFSLSGPIAGWLASLAFMVAGILHTVRATEAALSSFPFVPVAMLKSSFVSGTLLTYLAPKTMMLPLSQPIPISPLFMIGFSGLLSSALNLLPIFRLDGGRSCSAAMGARFGGLASAGTLLFILSFPLSTNSGLAFVWGILVVLFQRRPEIPVRNDVTEVDDRRLGAWIFSLAIAVLSLAPFPGGGSL